MTIESFFDGTHYSLCQIIVNEHFSGTKYFKLLRLADYLKVNESDLKKDTPRKLYKDPNLWVDRDKKVISMLVNNISISDRNRVGIWKWGVVDSYKTHSEEIINAKVIEVISAETIFPGIDKKSLADSFDDLLSGIPIPNGFPNQTPFLIKIGEVSGNYLCLLIDAKVKYHIESSKLFIDEGEKVTIHSLPQSDFVDSRSAFNTANQVEIKNVFFESHCVYLRYPAPSSPIATIELHKFSTLLGLYLDGILKKLNYPKETKALINDITSILEIENSPDSVTGFSNFIREYIPLEAEKITLAYLKKYVENTVNLKKILSGGETEKNFLTQLIEGVPELKEKYLQFLSENYLTDKKASIDGELNVLKKEKTNLEAEIKANTDKNIALNNEEEKLKTEIQRLIDLKASLKSEVGDHLKDFSNNLGIIRDILALSGQTSAEQTFSTSAIIPTNNSFSKQILNAQIIKQTIPVVPANSEQVADLHSQEEITNLIYDNLGEIFSDDAQYGLTDDAKKNYAHLILGAYLNGTPVLCYGCGARYAAQLISLSLSGTTAEVLCTETGFNAYNELIEKVRSTSSSFVILENLIGFGEEFCYLHLAEDVPEKHIIYVSEFVNSMKLLPADIYSYLVGLNCELMTVQNGIIDCGKIDDTVINNATASSINAIDLEKQAKLLKKLLNKSNLLSGYAGLRLSIMGKLDDGSVEMLFEELKSIFSLIGRSEDYDSYLDETSDKFVEKFAEYILDDD